MGGIDVVKFFVSFALLVVVNANVNVLKTVVRGQKIKQIHAVGTLRLSQQQYISIQNDKKRAIGRMNDEALKFCQNECDDMCECHCYCENPCIFRDVNNKEFQQYLSQYKVKVNFYQDQIFGEACILQKISTGELSTVKVIEYNNENKFLQGDQQFKRRMQIFHPNIVNLKHVESFTEDSFCALSIKNFLFFDFLLIDLDTEINYRRKTNAYFKEEELWNLIEGTLQALYYFQEIRLEHRGLRANRIYVSQSGQFKIADPYLFQNSINYEEVKEAYSSSEYIPQNIFLSPDQFFKLVNEDEYKILNKYENRLKSDIYSLGMVILSAATLDNLGTLYNYEESSMNFQSIVDKIENIIQKYKSPILGKLLHGMLDENQDKRFDAKKALLLIQNEERVKQAIIQSRTHNQVHTYRDIPTPLIVQITDFLLGQRSLGVINEIFENDNLQFQNLGNNSFEDRISNPLDVSRIGGATPIKQGTLFNMQAPMMRGPSQIQISPQKHESEQALRSMYNLEYKKTVDGRQLDFAFNGLGEETDQIQLSDLGTIALNNTQKTLLERLWEKCKESKFVQKMKCCKKKSLSNEQILTQVKFGIIQNESRDIIYEGNLYQDLIKHGQGKLYEDSQIYIGNFNLDMKDGFGKITDLKDNVLFEGHFVNNKKEGEGKEYNYLNDDNKNIHFSSIHQNWKSFEGMYQNGKKNGKGVYTYYNNHKFQCNFINNFADGEGQYLNEEGQVMFKAIYKRNRIQRVIQNFSFNPPNRASTISIQQLSPHNMNSSFAQQSHHSLLQQDQVVENSNPNSPNKNKFMIKQTHTVDVNEIQFK